MTYDQWKAIDPSDEELGNAKQANENDELEAAYAEIHRLQEALEHVSDHSCAAERMEFIKRQGADFSELVGIMTTEELLRTRRRSQLKGNERLAQILFRALEGREG
jgi:hypothetical protein